MHFASLTVSMSTVEAVNSTESTRVCLVVTYCAAVCLTVEAVNSIESTRVCLVVTYCAAVRLTFDLLSWNWHSALLTWRTVTPFLIFHAFLLSI